MKNKVCLVTGGNAGIGKATALGLAKLGAIVVLVCRNKSEGEKTIQTISEVSQTSGHKLLNADLSDFDSIRRCANDFKKQFNRLDVLINNAGAFYTKRQYTRNNVEMQFSVNHLAPFLLTNLLLEVLLKCD
ncbi:MAG: SDR family NAD(P)-dependent oxidoreductase, partial [Crocinitomicaceae bacterium]|nr:SDR family NAD(P)-dependent oxidoreductase [Crocinitomicaceae bacterium]